MIILLSVTGCGADRSTPTPAPSGPLISQASQTSPSSPDVARCLQLSTPRPPVVACAELRAGVETYSDRSPRQLTGGDYYLVGACVAQGDLDELPYTVTVDGKEVSGGSIACRDGVTTKNSAFSNREGAHEVTVRFDTTVGRNAEGWSIVTVDS